MSFSIPASRPFVVTGQPGNRSGFWKNQLSGAPERIAFSASHHHAVTVTSGEYLFKFALAQQHIDKLQHIGHQYEASLSTVLLTAFHVLLFRYTHQTDLVVGCPAVMPENSNKAGENVRELLPVRANLAENPSFADLLRQVQNVVDAVNIHYELVDIFTGTPPLEDALSFSPNVIFACNDVASAASATNSPIVNKFIGRTLAKGVQLAMVLENCAAGMNGIIQYDAAFFDVEAISGIAGHYQVLLNEIISDPAQRVAQICLLETAERNKLLYDWNNTKAEFSLDKCIHQLFEERVKTSPQAVAAVLHSAIYNPYDAAARQLTYAELDKRANQVAHYLQSIGVGPDVIVGVFMKRSLEMAVAILGILKAGGAYLPLDSGYPKERLDFIFKDSGISILLTQYQLLSKLPTYSMQVTCLDAEWSKIALYNDTAPGCTAGPQHLAYVIYTSGSTGLPKGTLIEHRGVVNYLSWCLQAYKINEGSGCPVSSSIGFDATVTSFLSPLVAGKKILLLPEDGEVETLAAALQSNSTFSLVKITPAHLEILNTLLPSKTLDKQANALVIGGESLNGKSLSHWRKHAPGTRLINEYGPTETVVGCCVYEVPAYKTFVTDVPVGRPIANTQIYILDTFMQPVPTGVTGEIYIGGAGVARGYLNRPELTAERFIPDPFTSGQYARLYKTGDIARYLPDGNIIFLGRADSQVKIRGYRIELEEIEHTLQQCDYVTQAVVTAKEDKAGDKQLVGYFVPNPAAIKLKEHELYHQRVANWKELYENEYSRATANENIDPEFNITGWNDSFTGQAMPAAHMKEWLDDIVTTVLTEQPKNVLEIGCGTGLVYYQLAGKIDKYVGSDLSASSILQIKARIQKQERHYCATELFTAPAHEVSLQPGWQPDTILLNSMVQYFPGEAYMDAVIKNCMAMVKDKGRIIIGDVRDYRLLSLFKGRLKLQKSPDTMPVKDFKRDVNQDILNEEELCFSPDYFYGLREVYRNITHIDIRWKKAGYTNELSLYRYTVVIYVGTVKETAGVPWQNWDYNAGNSNVFLTSGLLQTCVAITNIPNPRLYRERQLQEALQNESISTIAEVKQAIEREDREHERLKELFNVAKAKGYRQTMFVHTHPLKLNILFELYPSTDFIKLPPAQTLPPACDAKSNIPLFTDISYLLQKDIRKTLLRKLPEYMVPAELIAVAEVPLTKNGKIDRLFLNGIEKRETFKAAGFKEPSTTEEKVLAQIWMEILSIKQVSIYDDFFELGGNSLQAFRMFSKIRMAFGKTLSLGLLHKASSIEKLVEFLNKDTTIAAWRCLVPIQSAGLKPPIFCVHGGWGHVLFYRDLAKHLGADQPFYGLQVKGLNGKDRPYYRMEDMAAHYISEIRSVQPTGPYYLGGYCYGIIVAFEMAQQLLQQGQQVALLANFNGVSPLYLFPENFKKSKKIVDPITPGNTNMLNHGHKKLVTSSTQNQHLPAVTDRVYLSLKRVKADLKKYLGKLTKSLPWIPYKVAFKFYLATGKVMPEQILKMYIFNAMGMAQGKYIPKVYPGEMVIFRSPQFFKTRHLGWSQFVSGPVKTIDIPGEHAARTAILHEPHVQLVADELKKYMDTHPE